MSVMREVGMQFMYFLIAQKRGLEGEICGKKSGPIIKEDTAVKKRGVLQE